MEKSISKYLRGDKTIWTIFIVLSVISVIVLFSASSTLAFKASNHQQPILMHIAFLSIGAFFAFVVHLVPYKYIRILGYLGFIISFSLLVYLSARGVVTNNARRWISILGISFQPSELAKLSLIIVVADLVSRVRAKPTDENKIFKIILYFSIPTIGLIFLENFSTAAIIGFTIFSIMFLGQISYKKLLPIIAIILVLVLSILLIAKSVDSEKLPRPLARATTWVNRIINLSEDKNPEKRFEINDKNYQVQQGRIAVAHGGLKGVFPGNSIQRDYLPHAFDDFIFAIILEEMGLIGGIFIMILYMALLFRTGQIATLCRSTFPALLVTGLGLIITLQASVNMLVGSGFGLVTGQTLPLISRGGTSIVITSIYFGIILGIIRQIKEEAQAENFDENIDEGEVIDIETI